MLFNSYQFIFVFLPVALLTFFLGKALFKSYRLNVALLTLLSFFFYADWSLGYFYLFLGCILIDFFLGKKISQTVDLSRKKLLLVIGITINLSTLFYFKYFNLFTDFLNYLGVVDYHFEKIILPLAISFYTFQKIAFLVDCYKGLVKPSSLWNYLLFISFFAQLIAGPIVHYAQLFKQYSKSTFGDFNSWMFAQGTALFALGLFKKTVLADSVAVYASSIYGLLESGYVPKLIEAWASTLSYSLQIYFDFSGYSDMGIGLGLMFGIRLPFNFNSPYKSTNIIDFWRTWHMTLSQFLRDYLYIPLGGNRKGKSRRYINLMIVMLLGGLWHGAGINFVIWGFLHGCYLGINHFFQGKLKVKTISWGLTYIGVLFAWVFFRAETFNGAIVMVKSMLGFNGIDLPVFLGGTLKYLGEFNVQFTGISGLDFKEMMSWIIVLHIIAFFFPNSQELIMSKEVSATPRKFKWDTNWYSAVIIALMFIAGVFHIAKTNEFLYFQF